MLDGRAHGSDLYGDRHVVGQQTMEMQTGPCDLVEKGSARTDTTAVTGLTTLAARGSRRSCSPAGARGMADGPALRRGRCNAHGGSSGTNAAAFGGRSSAERGRPLTGLGTTVNLDGIAARFGVGAWIAVWVPVAAAARRIVARSLLSLCGSRCQSDATRLTFFFLYFRNQCRGTRDNGPSRLFGKKTKFILLGCPCIR